MIDGHAPGGGGSIVAVGDLNQSGNGVTVTELPDGPSGDVFGGVIRAFQRQGFDDGYRRAISDVRTSLFALTETFLRQRPELSEERRHDLRHVVCDLELHLIERLQAAGASSAFMEGGLGI